MHYIPDCLLPLKQAQSERSNFGCPVETGNFFAVSFIQESDQRNHRQKIHSIIFTQLCSQLNDLVL